MDVFLYFFWKIIYQNRANIFSEEKRFTKKNNYCMNSLEDESITKFPRRVRLFRKKYLFYKISYDLLGYLSRPTLFAIAFQALLVGNTWIPRFISNMALFIYTLWILLLTVKAVDCYNIPKDPEERKKYESFYYWNTYISGVFFVFLVVSYMSTLIITKFGYIFDYMIGKGNSEIDFVGLALELGIVFGYVLPLLLAGIMRGCLKYIILYGIQYMIYEPFYSVIVPITAILHWTQGSWGNRGNDEKVDNEMSARNRSFAGKVLTLNLVFIIIIGIVTYVAQENRQIYPLWILLGIVLITGYLPHFFIVIFFYFFPKKIKVENFPGLYIDKDRLNTAWLNEHHFDLVKTRSFNTITDILYKTKIIDFGPRGDKNFTSSRKKNSFSDLTIGVVTPKKGKMIRKAKSSFFANDNIIELSTKSLSSPSSSSTSSRNRTLRRAASKRRLIRSGSGALNGGLIEKDIESEKSLYVPVVFFTPIYREKEVNIKETIDSYKKMSFSKIEKALKVGGFENNSSLRNILVVFCYDGGSEINEQGYDISETWQGLMNQIYGSSDQKLVNGRKIVLKSSEVGVYYHVMSKTLKTAGGEVNQTYNLWFAVLHKNINKGKRDSQILFYDFIRYLENKKCITGTKYTIMLDSDTSFEPDGPARLLVPLVDNNSISCSCGYLGIKTEINSINPVIGSQKLEYKINFELAKWYESLYFSVTCSPGAYMAITMNALKSILDNEETHYRMSREKIRQIIKPRCFKVWNYLEIGEDRYMTSLMILNPEKHGTVYVPSAKGLTSPPSSPWGLLLQRRRWTNSTISNFIYLIERFLED